MHIHTVGHDVKNISYSGSWSKRELKTAAPCNLAERFVAQYMGQGQE